MNAWSRDALIRRMHQEVSTILTEGDKELFQRLSRHALCAVLENELRFLGLYPHSHTETPRMIHAILEEYLDVWVAAYLRQPSITVTLIESPFLQHITTSAVGLVQSPTTYYVRLTSGIEIISL